ncbi:Nn.00g030660.m01.CDS01 [Neocucurbitaria sp. VM-36]
MAAAMPKNNAFGDGSPSWNLPFPDGNLTSAEIIAYLPHWLKSIDVIDRFVTNGARSTIIAAMINAFRDQPRGEAFLPNSVGIMMSFAMRRAGYAGWTVGTHELWSRESELDEGNLSVKGFRPPRITHPKQVYRGGRNNTTCNIEAEPVQFKDLALHVKKHPTNADALDLTRCVQYALVHQNEEWLFPDDFQYLVIHLGGPVSITHSHQDRQVFARRDSFASPAKSRLGTGNRTPKAKATPRAGTMHQTRIERTSSLTRATTPMSMTLQKRGSESMGRVLLGSKRRSGRLVDKAINFREEESDTTDKDYFDSPYSGYSTPGKKRKLSRIPATPASASNDSDFEQDESEPDDDTVEAEDGSDEDVVSPSRGQRVRAAAKKARQSIQSSFMTNRVPLVLKVPQLLPSPEKQVPLPAPEPEPKPIPKYMATEPSAEMMQAVYAYASRTPILLKPPVLSATRLRVDAASIYLYAAEGCTSLKEMWDSALSSTRFGGPRRHPPFRELYRLTDPNPSDDSDWAENIRWAKEQYKAFGSMTWTEYDYHLELITEARRETMWVSEEAIMAGM